MVLDELCRLYPLTSEWGIPEIFSETTCVHDVTVHVAGLCVQNGAGETVTGSAGDLLLSPVDRAYFELLERTSIVTALRNEDRIRTSDTAGFREEYLGVDAVFPSTSDESRWRYAKSNGVAAGFTWYEACARAEWELIERDRILRCWYGGRAPTRVGLPTVGFPNVLNGVYSFEAYLFEDLDGSEVHVAGIFGFPRGADVPLVYGFGARPSQDRAVEAATKECIQRLGFLWGEEIPCSSPEPSPTPDFHQEFFLWPSAHERLRRWLLGAHCDRGPIFARQKPALKEGRRFADLTPPALADRLFVAKAIPDAELLLAFGVGNPDFTASLPEDLRIHPIS